MQKFFRPARILPAKRDLCWCCHRKLQPPLCVFMQSCERPDRWPTFGVGVCVEHISNIYILPIWLCVCVCVVEKRIFVHCCSAWLKIDYKQISKRYSYTGHRLMVQMRRFIIRFSIEIYLLCHKRGTRKTKAKTQSFSTGRFNYVNSWTEHIYNAYAYCY